MNGKNQDFSFRVHLHEAHHEQVSGNLKPRSNTLGELGSQPCLLSYQRLKAHHAKATCVFPEDEHLGTIMELVLLETSQ